MQISKTLSVTNRDDWRAWLENKADPLKDKTADEAYPESKMSFFGNPFFPLYAVLRM